MDSAQIVAGTALVASVATGIVTFLRVGPERDSIIVTSAREVVVIQRETIDELTAGLREAREKIQLLESKMRDVEAENRFLRAENDRLRLRVRHLETDLERRGGESS